MAKLVPRKFKSEKSTPLHPLQAFSSLRSGVLLLSLCTNLLYRGYVMDKRGGFLAIMASCALCSLGCFIRGFATNTDMLFLAAGVLGLGAGSLWACVLGYISSITPIAHRNAVVSSFLLQVTVLRIAAKALYPAWHYLLVEGLEIKDELFRDRISMGVCTGNTLFIYDRG